MDFFSFASIESAAYDTVVALVAALPWILVVGPVRPIAWKERIAAAERWGNADFCSRLPDMDLEQLRKLCLSFPGATEQIQWGNDLLFKVGGKMFAATPLEPARVCLSFKASPENFADLTERPNIIPAPYLARAQWVALEARDALAHDELALLLRDSYDMVVAKLPKKTREAFSRTKPAARTPTGKRRAKKKCLPGR